MVKLTIGINVGVGWKITFVDDNDAFKVIILGKNEKAVELVGVETRLGNGKNDDSQLEICNKGLALALIATLTRENPAALIDVLDYAFAAREVDGNRDAITDRTRVRFLELFDFFNAPGMICRFGKRQTLLEVAT